MSHIFVCVRARVSVCAFSRPGFSVPTITRRVSVCPPSHPLATKDSAVFVNTLTPKVAQLVFTESSPQTTTTTTGKLEGASTGFLTNTVRAETKL